MQRNDKQHDNERLSSWLSSLLLAEQVFDPYNSVSMV